MTGQWSLDEMMGGWSVQGAPRAVVMVLTAVRNGWDLSMLGWSHETRVSFLSMEKPFQIDSRQWILVNVGRWSTNPMIPCLWWWWWSTSTRFWTTRHMAVGKPVKENIPRSRENSVENALVLTFLAEDTVRVTLQSPQYGFKTKLHWHVVKTLASLSQKSTETTSGELALSIRWTRVALVS